MPDVTVCLTTCNKFGSLKKTLDSFLNYNTYPIKRILIRDDSTNLSVQNQIKSRYGSKIELIESGQNIGQAASIDKLYSNVDTEYIFHCEDDWVFIKSEFIQHSLDVLRENTNINQVWIRNVLPGHPHKLSEVLEPQLYTTQSKVQYKLVQSPHHGSWCGFSWNPGLRKLSDYKKMFPEGFSKFAVYVSNVPTAKPNALSELNCSIHALSQGYRAAALLKEYCRHIG